MEEGGEAGEGIGLASGSLNRVIEYLKRQPSVPWMLAGLLSTILYAASFPNVGAAEGAYVFAVPLLLASWFLPEISKRALIGIALGSGWLSWMWMIAWLRQFSSHLDMGAPWIPGWIAWIALSLVLACFHALWLFSAVWLFRKSLDFSWFERVAGLLGIAGLWVFVEWVRSWFLSGFPWLPLSVSHWERPLLLQISSVTGAWGVSFVLVAFNVGLAYYLIRLWEERRRKWWQRISPEFYVALILLVGSILIGIREAGTGREIPLYKVGFVQPSVGSMQKWEPDRIQSLFSDLRQLSTYSVALGADVVLWPESPTPGTFPGNPAMERWVSTMSSEMETPLLAGTIASHEQDGEILFYNAVATVDPESGVGAEFYAKRHLVPFGETIPLGLNGLLNRIFPLPMELQPGSDPNVLTLWVKGQPSRIGNLICYEDVYPALGRKTAKAGVDWIYVATNNAWFGRGAGAIQHAAHSVLRAVELRRPVVRCGNSGWSGWIDSFGHVRHRMVDGSGSIYFRGADAATIGISGLWQGRLSTYVRWGDWFVLLSALLASGAFFLVRSSTGKTSGEGRG